MSRSESQKRGHPDFDQMAEDLARVCNDYGWRPLKVWQVSEAKSALFDLVHEYYRKGYRDGWNDDHQAQ